MANMSFFFVFLSNLIVTDIVCLSKNIIMSSSKDTLMKVWDLDTQHCIQTVVGHRSEVWSIDADSNTAPKYVVTGSAGTANSPLSLSSSLLFLLSHIPPLSYSSSLVFLLALIPPLSYSSSLL